MQLNLAIQEQAIAKAVALKQRINATLDANKDEFGYGGAQKHVPGWDLRISYTPHSNQGIELVAQNAVRPYRYYLDIQKLDQGHIALISVGVPNQTSIGLLLDFFKEWIG